MEHERFMITIYVFLIALWMKDYSMNTEDLSNLYNGSIVCSFSPASSMNKHYRKGTFYDHHICFSIGTRDEKF